MRFFLKMKFRIPPATPETENVGYGILHVIIAMRVDTSPVPVYLIGYYIYIANTIYIGDLILGDLELVDYIKIIFVKHGRRNWNRKRNKTRNRNWNWICVYKRCKFDACCRFVPQFQGVAIHPT